MITSLSVIFPIYNEEKRLLDCFKDIKKFLIKSKVKKLEFIFVNDGSTDNSFKIIKKFTSTQKIKFKIINSKKNLGKGFALKKGVLASKNDWVLTLDTDISVSLDEINRWIKKKYIKNNKIYFASRNLKSSNVEYKIHRKFIGLIFILLCRILLGIKLSDTQCGFKLYEKKTAKKIFKILKENRFAHDIEIVQISNRYKTKIIELPVKWVHKENSKINLIKDSLDIFFSLLKIRFGSKY